MAEQECEDKLILDIVEAAKKGQQQRIEGGKLALQGQATPSEWKSIVQRIAEMQTPEEASAAAEDVTLLESLLRHAHQYGEQATQYCILEARMYVRIASLFKGWSFEERCKFEDMADSKTLRLVRWVGEKSDDDLAWVMSRVAEGRRIAAVRADEMKAARQMLKQDKYAATAQRLVDMYKDWGKTTINIESFCDNFEGRGEVDAKAACVWIDQARKEVRKLGGVGVGDGDGKYIAVDPNDSSSRLDLTMAILNRMRSIERDLKRMHEICKEANLEPPRKELNAVIKSAKEMLG